MKRLLPLLLLAAFASCASAQTSIAGSDGTLVAPTTVGQSITITNVHTSAGVADVRCPITFFGSGTNWVWYCSAGTLSVNGVVVASISGKLVKSCSYCGPYRQHAYAFIFNGTTQTGYPVYAKAVGPGSTYAPAVAFTATY